MSGIFEVRHLSGGHNLSFLPTLGEKDERTHTKTWSVRDNDSESQK